jgi:hypothetical protein
MYSIPLVPICLSFNIQGQPISSLFGQILPVWLRPPQLFSCPQKLGTIGQGVVTYVNESKNLDELSSSHHNIYVGLVGKCCLPS